MDLGPSGPDLGPDLDPTWDLDLSLTILKIANKVPQGGELKKSREIESNANLNVKRTRSQVNKVSSSQPPTVWKTA